jgi:hypothetical protein
MRINTVNLKISPWFLFLWNEVFWLPNSLVLKVFEDIKEVCYHYIYGKNSDSVITI